MQQFKIASAHEAGPKVCKALGIEPGRVSRVIIDLDTHDPAVRVYVQMFADDVGINAVLDVLLPWKDLEGLKGE